MIPSLLITIAIEATVIGAYSVWRRKPFVSILLTSLVGNLITQALLWTLLYYFFQRYLTVLWVAELLIWMLESLLLYGVPSNRLNFRESLCLSLGMNLASFAMGWWLPV